RMLAGQEAARPAVTALNLVQNQQDVRLVAQGADRLKERVGNHLDAAFTLDRLDHNGAGAVGDRIIQLREVPASHMLESGGQRLERLLVFGLRGGGDRGESAAVERARERDDLMAVRPLELLAPLAGDLD